MFQTHINGAYFRSMAVQHTVLSLPVGARLWLVPDPDNQYDANAIEVWNIEPGEGIDREQHFLGFIPKEDCEDVHPYVEEGDYQCRVSELGGLKPKLHIGFGFEFEAQPEESDDAGPADGEA